ncbi:hypothetical protein D6817_03115 [Candidatus Pacearchaeota archaeon]|nr:MAG: hypothetical protein D6817_03115 [Candidatus Pacearchaeota archaeon]
MGISTRRDLIEAFINFFKSKKHKEIPSASLIPENDPTVLFTTAGMHPLVPFLQGEKHPLGRRLTSVQKCLRTGDIDEVGDSVHHTFFEMLGNWSLGDYWKKEAIEFSFEFLTKVLGFPKERLAISCFAGDGERGIPKDDESAEIWESLGVPRERIAFLGMRNNWWGPAGETGPCGPDTEMFYWVGEDEPPERFDPSDERWVEIWNDVFMEYERKKLDAIFIDEKLLFREGRLARDIWDVLEQFKTKKFLVVGSLEEFKKSAIDDFSHLAVEVVEFPKTSEELENLFDEKKLSPALALFVSFGNTNAKLADKFPEGLRKASATTAHELNEVLEKNVYFYAKAKQRNVDTGMGVERTLSVLDGSCDDYLTDSFLPLIREIEKLSGKSYEEKKREMRIIADHLRAAVFILGDERGVRPSNVQQGYVLRRLIRRAIRYAKLIGLEKGFATALAKVVIAHYPDYQELARNHKFIVEELELEEERFLRTLEKGLKKFNEVAQGEVISGKDAFLLFQSYGFPIEMTLELANERGVKVDLEAYNEEFRRHQELSRTASRGMFKSGLADESEKTRKLHTATHLLNEALRKVLGDENIKQKGSNITPERLRFDFNFPRKLTKEEIEKIEELVNEKIAQGLEVVREEMPLGQAMESGAQAEFGARYPEVVSVYTILDPSDPRGWFSKEICTGPHVKNTAEIGKFKIVKEESVAAGIRRIKAVVE